MCWSQELEEKKKSDDADQLKDIALFGVVVQ